MESEAVKHPHGSTVCVEAMSYGEIAKRLGMSRQGVEQAEKRALKKLRIRLIELGVRNSRGTTDDEDF